MSLETALVKANSTDVHYQAFMSELLQVDDFASEHMPMPVGEAAVARLHRPGAEYLNMNPYYVLLLDPGCTLDEVKAQYRKMSLQVHPDKHANDPRASAAFEIVRKAYDKVRAAAVAPAPRKAAPHRSFALGFWPYLAPADGQCRKARPVQPHLRGCAQAFGRAGQAAAQGGQEGGARARGAATRGISPRATTVHLEDVRRV
mmetsp:Transcript_12378/g.32355  ORF Transcript_12378/g.32355 Transcript_12378/m.32355 type:complete len:202 (+) Transcript_12378:130-735(+)